ncbi:MAG TPA: hypothetical protein VML01_11780 [Bryobacterales bacterium]|nr:hypothetical protein [Bryobacterales bacterium]
MPDATDEFVTVFTSRSHDAEIEAEAVHGLLESSGIESLIVRENVLEMPVGRVSVKVFSSYQGEAEGLIEAAQAPRNGDLDDDEFDDDDSDDDDSDEFDDDEFDEDESDDEEELKA